MRRVSMILVALGLCACQTRPVVPKLVHVTVVKIVPVPEQLAKDCDIPQKRNGTVGEAIRLATARMEALLACNADKARIRALGKD